MRRALQKCNEGSKHVVKVVAYGDWTTMCNQLSTYLKCDDPNPGKHERKLHAKKKISESEDEEENKTKKSMNKQKKEITKLKSNAKNTIGCSILQKLKNKNDKDDNTKQTRHNNSSSSDESIVGLKKTQGVQKLFVEKSKLQEEKILKDIVHIYEAVKRLKKKLDKILDTMERMESYLKCRSNDNSIVKFADNDIENGVMVLPVLHEINTDGSYILEERKDEFQKDTPDILNVAVEMEEISKANGASSSKMDAKEIIDVMEPKVSSTKTSKICNDTAELNGCRGNRLVTKAQLAKLNNSSLSKLTCDLLTIVFDKKELKESSLTGQKANVNKNKNATKKLDSDKVAAVEDKIVLCIQ